MIKRLKQDVLSGPNGEMVKVSWMPHQRLRLDFIKCGPCAVTKIFPDPNTKTARLEVAYGNVNRATLEIKK